MNKFFKDTRGSVSIMVYVLMLFISLYGAIILGTSSRKYEIQSENINTIIESYKFQDTEVFNTDDKYSMQQLINLYENVGGTEVLFK